MSSGYRAVNFYLKDNEYIVDLGIVGKAKTISVKARELNLYQESIVKSHRFLTRSIFNASQKNDVVVLNEIIKKFASNKNIKVPFLLVLLIMIYVSAMIISNMTGGKLTTFMNNTIPSGLYFFPITYIVDDILTEVYGYNMSRRIIWFTFGINILITVGCFIAVQMPASPHWHDQEAFNIVFGQTPKVLIASVLSYFFGEFLNSIILSKTKVMTLGKNLPFRMLLSTLFGVTVDSLIFCNIVFQGVLPFSIISHMILLQIMFKLGYEVLMLPLSLKLIAYIKNKENTDVFDFNINYNPFEVK